MTARPLSRPKRWSAAAQKLADAVDKAQEALSELQELQSEYEDILGNVPDNLRDGAFAEKLQAIVDLDLESGANELENLAGEVEGMDLPLGFGRD